MNEKLKPSGFDYLGANVFIFLEKRTNELETKASYRRDKSLIRRKLKQRLFSKELWQIEIL